MRSPAASLLLLSVAACLLPAARPSSPASLLEVETLASSAPDAAVASAAAPFRQCRSHTECTGAREVCMFSYGTAARASVRSGICYVDGVSKAQAGGLDLDLSLLEMEATVGAGVGAGVGGAGDTSTLKLMAPKGFASSLVLGTPKYQSYKIGVNKEGQFSIAQDANPYVLMDGATVQMKTRTLSAMNMGVAAGSTFMIGTMPQWSLVR